MELPKSLPYTAPMTIKAFLFDLDGTLFDTLRANYLAYHEVLTDFGINLSEEIFSQHRGLGYLELISRIAPTLNPQEQQIVKKLKAQAYPKYLHEIIPNKSLLSFLEYVHSQYKTALVSTASNINASHVLNFFKATSLFDLCIFGEDVKSYKPHPEAYLLALEKLDVNANQALAFEDSEVGLQSARQAGIKTIIVPPFK